MKTITMKFPEVKVEIPIEGLSFTKLELIALDISRQIGRAAIETFVQALDELLMGKRKRGVLENKGTGTKHISTWVGDVIFSRTRYKQKATDSWRYLVDEKLGLKRDQRVSASRQKLEMHMAIKSVYRKASEVVRKITGSSRSHEAIRQSIIGEGEKIREAQERSFQKTRFMEYETDTEAPHTLYTEGDGVQVRLQKPAKGPEGTKKKNRRHMEVKVGMGYTGRKPRYDGGEGEGMRLENKFVYISTENRSSFMEKFSLMMERRFNLTEARKTFFGSDGDPWLKRKLREFFPPSVEYILCRLHLRRNVTRVLAKWRGKSKKVMDLLRKDRVKEALDVIRKLAEKTSNDRSKEDLWNLHTYIANNENGIKAGNRKADGEKITGAIEATICSFVAKRLKRRGMSWSRDGATALVKVKELIDNEDWDNWWQTERDDTVRVRGEWKSPLSAKHFKSTVGKGEPLLEARVPALDGPDQDKPWSGVLRDLTALRYGAH